MDHRLAMTLQCSMKKNPNILINFCQQRHWAVEQLNNVSVGLILSNISLSDDFCDRTINLSKGQIRIKFAEINGSI